MDSLLARLEKTEQRPTPFWCVPSRIAYIVNHSYPFSSNGYAVRTHGIARALVEHGHSVIAITRPGLPWDLPGFDGTNFDRFHEIEGVRYLHLKEPSSIGKSQTEYLTQAVTALKEYFQLFKPSVVMAASNWENALPAAIAACELGLPFFYEVRGFWEITRASVEPAWQDSDEFNHQVKMEVVITKQADHVFTLNRFMKKELVKRGVKEAKIDILPNGYGEFPRLSKTAKVTKTDLGIKNKYVVGYIGSFNQYEGLEDLIKACAVVRQKGVDLSLLLVGGSDHIGAKNGMTCKATLQFHQLAKENGFEQFLFTPGRVISADVSDFYGMIDLVVIPRKPMPVCKIVSPLKPLEAIAHKKNVLLPDLNPMIGIENKNNSVYYYVAGNREDLEKSIFKLLKGNVKARRGKGAYIYWVSCVESLVKNIGALQAVSNVSNELEIPIERPGNLQKLTKEKVGISQSNKLKSIISESVISEGGSFASLNDLQRKHKIKSEDFTEALLEGMKLLEFVKTKPKILVVGHDLRFVQPFIDYFKQHFDVLIDIWSATNKHDEKNSLVLLEKADLIWCEWCCGNAVWYSKNKLKRQKLIVRLHKFEINTPFPSCVVWDNVNALIFIAEGMRKYANKIHKITCQQYLLYNGFDVDKVDSSYDGERDLFSIATLGYVPIIKRLDKSLDFFELAFKSDPRFSFHMKGKSAEEISWVWEKEKKYFITQNERIKVLENAGALVTREKYDDGVHKWLGQKGFILSASDIEGSHQAVAEAMACGTVPILFGDWVNTYDARSIYPSELCFGNIDLAFSFMKRLVYKPEEYIKISKKVRDFSHENFNHNGILHNAISIISGKKIINTKYIPIKYPKRIMIFTDLCVNVIDGSSVWLFSLLEMLLIDKNIEVILISREKIKNPDRLGSYFKTERFYFEEYNQEFNELKIEKYLQFFEEKIKQYNVTKVIVRAQPSVANRICDCVSINNINKIIYYLIGEAYPKEKFLRTTNAIFFQTEESQNRFYKKFPAWAPDKNTKILRPMIPDHYTSNITLPKSCITISYTGKLCKSYKAQEMLNFINNSPDYINSILCIAKYQQSDGQDYVKKVKASLNIAKKSGKALVVESASREDVKSLVSQCHVGWSIRSDEYKYSSEISTKVLEYCSLGKPVLLNHCASNVALLGEEYPLYAENEVDAIKLINQLRDDHEFYQELSEYVVKRVSGYKMSYTYTMIIDDILN